MTGPAARPARANKYRARPTEVDGIRFASAAEARRYRDLKLLERAGEIAGLTLQPRFPLTVNGEPVKIRSTGYPNGRAAEYRADFAYFRGGHRVVEDVKGLDTPVSRLKRALVETIYHVRVKVVR